MNCRFHPLALLEILSIVRRHGLIHDNNNVSIENIHVISLWCGVQSIKLLQLAVNSIILRDYPNNYIKIRHKLNVLAIAKRL